MKAKEINAMMAEPMRLLTAAEAKQKEATRAWWNAVAELRGSLKKLSKVQITYKTVEVPTDDAKVAELKRQLDEVTQLAASHRVAASIAIDKAARAEGRAKECEARNRRQMEQLVEIQCMYDNLRAEFQRRIDHAPSQEIRPDR